MNKNISRNNMKDKNPTAGMTAIKMAVGVPLIVFCAILFQVTVLFKGVNI